MKYFLKVLIALIAALVVVYGAYCITNSTHNDISKSKSHLTTVTKAPVTEKGSNRVLLNSIEEDGHKIELYQRDNETILVHNGKEYVYDDWSRYITLDKPDIRYGNYDTDFDDKEIAIRLVSNVDEASGDYMYDIYLLNIFEDENGEEQMDLIVAGTKAWNKLLNEKIAMEISQLSSCKKLIQIAMTYKWKNGINYNEDGIADSPYTNFVHALKDGKGGYMETERWVFGKTVYSFTDKNHIKASVDILIKYKDYDTMQNAGTLRMELLLGTNYDFICQQNTVGFTSNPEYKSLNPRQKSNNRWRYVENNSNKSVSAEGDKVIDWLKYTFAYDPSIKEKTVNYSNEETEIRNVDKVVFTNNVVKLYAKKGYSFSKVPIETGEYSVVINENDEKNRYELAYTAKITEENGQQVLTINFETSYPQDYFRTVSIYYNIES